MTVRWQSFVQLRDVAPDGTRWHSLCRPAPNEALAREMAHHWLVGWHLRELCDGDSPRTDPCPPPTHYFASDADDVDEIDKQWVRIALVQVDADDLGVAFLTKLPPGTKTYLSKYPPTWHEAAEG